MIGRVDIGIGTPLHDGVYAAEIYWGWKLLNWHNGEWWHTGCTGRWNAGIPVQWVGPLPRRQYDGKPKQEFDL